MNLGKQFAVGMIIAQVIASIGYLTVYDYKRALYWAFAAGINATVTF